MAEQTDNASKLEWLAGVAALLSILACYGTLFVISVLSALGITLVVHGGAWAGAISLFAVLAVVGVALGYRRHRVLAPLVLAAIGAAIIIWVIFGPFNRVLELIGFAALVIGATWDWRLKRRGRPPVPESA
ncbi:MAG: MerC domain-containing protein [Acidiferrobacterales bacterium]